MANLLEDGSGQEREYYVQYLKQLRGETVQRVLQKYEKLNLDFTGREWCTTI